MTDWPRVFKYQYLACKYKYQYSTIVLKYRSSYQYQYPVQQDWCSQ